MPRAPGRGQERRDGDTPVNVLSCIDLNPVRAGLVERPEDYRWCSLGYHVQSGNRGGFLSLDLELRQFAEFDDAPATLGRRLPEEQGLEPSSCVLRDPCRRDRRPPGLRRGLRSPGLE